MVVQFKIVFQRRLSPEFLIFFTRFLGYSPRDEKVYHLNMVTMLEVEETEIASYIPYLSLDLTRDLSPFYFQSKLDKKYFPQLSLPLSSIESRYDVVVIGSGYGGSIAACRSARAGQKVCVLERGKEWRPGDFPEKETETIGEIQMTHNNQKSVYGKPEIQQYTIFWVFMWLYIEQIRVSVTRGLKRLHRNTLN